MNAFLEIVAQLVAAVQPESWLEQRYFPFPNLKEPRGRFVDACVFRQDAHGALGLLWISFDGMSDLMTFPFRLARHGEDGDLISLSPWSLREASSDPFFFDSWKRALHNKTTIVTENGAHFRVRYVGGEPNLLALNVSSDRKSVLSRLEMVEAIKIFRILSRENNVSPEVEMLEYLSTQKTFLSFPRLIAVYEYIAKNSPVANIAISTEYIHNNGPLWHDYLARLQVARFPDPEKEKTSREAWDDVLSTTENLGRLLGEFHRAMTNARENPSLVPEANFGEHFKNWLVYVRDQLSGLCCSLEAVVPRYPHFSPTMTHLASVVEVVLSKVGLFDSYGFRIRTHGRIHLGHVLNGVKGLYLFDFGMDPNDDFDADARHHGLSKQPSLMDLAALSLSLRYAWYMTDRRGRSPIIEEFLVKEDSVVDKFDGISMDHSDVCALPIASRKLLDVEGALLRAYMSAIGEDSSAAELVPNAPGAFLALYDLLFLFRILVECKKDFSIGNPRLKTSLRILGEFSKTVMSRGV